MVTHYLVSQQHLKLISLLQFFEEPLISLYIFCHLLKPAVFDTRPRWHHVGCVHNDTLEECLGIYGALKLPSLQLHFTEVTRGYVCVSLRKGSREECKRKFPIKSSWNSVFRSMSFWDLSLSGIYPRDVFWRNSRCHATITIIVLQCSRLKNVVLEGDWSPKVSFKLNFENILAVKIHRGSKSLRER